MQTIQAYTIFRAIATAQSSRQRAYRADTTMPRSPVYITPTCGCLLARLPCITLIRIGAQLAGDCHAVEKKCESSENESNHNVRGDNEGIHNSMSPTLASASFQPSSDPVASPNAATSRGAESPSLQA